VYVCVYACVCMRTHTGVHACTKCVHTSVQMAYSGKILGIHSSLQTSLFTWLVCEQFSYGFYINATK